MLTLELLKKILNDEIKNLSNRNLTKGKALLVMLETALKKYQNNLLTTVEIIQFLVDEVAKKVKDEYARTETLKMTVDEVAFYDVLAENESAVAVLGDEQLRELALEIADKIRAIAQMAHLVLPDTQANPSQNQKSHFSANALPKMMFHIKFIRFILIIIL